MRKIIVFLLFTASVISYGKNYEMPAVFSDNMVLQRNAEAPFWGKAKPDETVTVKASWGEEASAKADSDSLWMCKIKTPDAGGPYEVTVAIGGRQINYKNVLIGEVWICSGQSNMAMPMKGWPPNDTIQNSARDIAAANNSFIRFFTVERKISFEKLSNCGGTWLVCSPETAADFSATAYYFAKKLYDELKIPIGLINTSWGGTPVEAWADADFLAETPYYKTLTEDMKNVVAAAKQYNSWLESHTKVDVNSKPSDTKWQNLDLNDDKYKNEYYNDGAWMDINLPGYIENSGLAGFDGAIWFRKKASVPEEWRGKELTLELGPIDDMDVTYVNGEKVGAYDKDGFYSTPRVYTVNKDLTESGSLLIAVRVIDPQGFGGFGGGEGSMKLIEKESDSVISLGGNWKCMPAAEWNGTALYIFDKGQADFDNRPKQSMIYSPNSPSVLYNGMIHPLIPYAIKGAIWYQGESNTGEPDKYAVVFPQMIKNWRHDWGYDFPFYYVQIAPYNYGKTTPAQRLREAQLKTLAVKNTGMAVTLDIGNPANIHPANKKDVGERLALWSLAKDFGKDVVFTGPIYKSMNVNGGNIILDFEYAEGLNIKPDNGKTYFLIAGADKVFKEAEVKADGNKLIVSSPEVKEPAAVRYSWENESGASLFNGAGLPASSFRTDNWAE